VKQLVNKLINFLNKNILIYFLKKKNYNIFYKEIYKFHQHALSVNFNDCFVERDLFYVPRLKEDVKL
jgi:hypothetical protein